MVRFTTVDSAWAELVYRLIAEGEQREAMEEFYDQFPFLSPPYAERNGVAVIARGRAKEAAQGALL